VKEKSDCAAVSEYKFLLLQLLSQKSYYLGQMVSLLVVVQWVIHSLTVMM